MRYTLSRMQNKKKDKCEICGEPIKSNHPKYRDNDKNESFHLSCYIENPGGYAKGLSIIIPDTLFNFTHIPNLNKFQKELTGKNEELTRYMDNRIREKTKKLIKYLLGKYTHISKKIRNNIIKENQIFLKLQYEKQLYSEQNKSRELLSKYNDEIKKINEFNKNNCDIVELNELLNLVLPLNVKISLQKRLKNNEIFRNRKSNKSYLKLIESVQQIIFVYATELLILWKIITDINEKYPEVSSVDIEFINSNLALAIINLIPPNEVDKIINKIDDKTNKNIHLK